MGAQAESRAHLRKAREFLDAARLEAERDLYTAAASSAVLAGINAKDTICLRLTGCSSKADAHRSAVPELAAAGPVGKALEPTFRRLLGLKTPPSTQTAAWLVLASSARTRNWTPNGTVALKITTSPTLVGPPTSKDKCLKSGWMTFNDPSFKNQGDCVSFVATGGKNTANG